MTVLHRNHLLIRSLSLGPSVAVVLSLLFPTLAHSQGETGDDAPGENQPTEPDPTPQEEASSREEASPGEADPRPEEVEKGSSEPAESGSDGSPQDDTEGTRESETTDEIGASDGYRGKEGEESSGSVGGETSHVAPSDRSAVEEEPLGEEEVVVVVGGGAPQPPPDRDGASEVSEEEVIVAGTRSAQMAGAIQVIGQKQLERVEYDDPHAVLRQVPGVSVRDEDGTGLRPNIAMRGVNPDRSKKVTLMEDGVLFGPAPYSAPAAYYFPMMTRMTQVRVIKGPGAVAFGPQTVGGAIDLITRRVPVARTLGTDLSYGEYGYRKVHAFAGTSNERFGVLFEGVHVGNDGFKRLASEENTGSARNEWMAKAFYLVDPTASVSNEFSVKLTYSDEVSNETYLGLTDEDFEQNPDWRYPASALDRMENHRTSVALSHELRSYEDHLSVRTTVYRNDFFRTWRKFNRLGGAAASSVLADPDDPQSAAYYGVLSGQSDTSGPFDTVYVGPNQREFVSQGVDSRLRWEPPGRIIKHKIEVGLRLHHDSIERDHSERAFQMAGGELYPTGEGAIQTARNQANTHALALNVTDAITWGSLTATPGVRVEALASTFDDFLQEEKTSRTVVAVMPGLGMFYGLTNSWGVLAGAYRGFSPPAPGSDSTVKPEMSINYEAGTRFAKERTRAEVIGFFNDYSNLTDVCTFSSGCLNANLDRQFDAGQANIYGVEVFGAHEVELGEFTFPLSLAYTLSFGSFRTDFVSADPMYGDVTTGDEIPYLPRHQVNAMAGFEVGRLEAYGIFNYVAATRELAGDQPLGEVMSTDPLVTFDAGLSVRALKAVKLYVNGRNLADYRAIVAHRPFGARPNAPRWVQVGVKAEF